MIDMAKECKDFVPMSVETLKRDIVKCESDHERAKLENLCLVTI